MANSKKPENEGMSQLVKKAKEDPKFFHELIWHTEKTLSSLDFLTRSEKASLLAVKPEDLVVGLASGFGGGPVADCGGTCGASCGGSCGASCGGSCTVTCAASCPATGVIPDPGQEVINPAETHTAQELSTQISKTLGQKFSRYGR